MRAAATTGTPVPSASLATELESKSRSVRRPSFGDDGSHGDRTERYRTR